MIADRVFWWLLLGYPILFAIADGRSIYSGESDAIPTNPLGAIGLLIQLTALVLAAGLTLTRVLSDARDHRPVPSVLPYIVVFFATAAAISVAKGEHRAALGAVLVCMALAAVSTTTEPPYVVLARIRAFLRVQILVSLALGIFLSAWALVPAEHTSRELFGIGSRLIGLTAGPNYMGATAAVLFSLEVFVATRGLFLRTTFALLAASATVWSQSRTGLGIITLACVLAILARIVPRKGFSTLAKIFIWGPILAMAATPFIILSFMDTNPDAMVSLTTGRVYIWQVSLDVVSTSPIFGMTHGEFDAVAQTYSSKFEFSNAHNQLLETTATGGALMAVLLLLLLFNLGKSLIRQARDNLTPLALSFGVLGQLPFGTPFRLSGLTWNLVALATLVLCTRPWVLPPDHKEIVKDVPPQKGRSSAISRPSTPRGSRVVRS